MPRTSRECAVGGHRADRGRIPDRVCSGQDDPMSPSEAARLESVLRLISPDHITPIGVRMIQQAMFVDSDHDNREHEEQPHGR